MSKEDWMPGEGQWIQPFRSIKKKTKASEQYYYEGWFGCGYYDPILTESPRNSHHTQNRPRPTRTMVWSLSPKGQTHRLLIYSSK